MQICENYKLFPIFFNLLFSFPFSSLSEFTLSLLLAPSLFCVFLVVSIFLYLFLYFPPPLFPLFPLHSLLPPISPLISSSSSSLSLSVVSSNNRFSNCAVLNGYSVSSTSKATVAAIVWPKNSRELASHGGWTMASIRRKGMSFWMGKMLRFSIRWTKRRQRSGERRMRLRFSVALVLLKVPTEFAHF